MSLTSEVMKPIKKTTVSVCAAIFMLQWQIWSHVPGGGSGGGAFGGSGAGRSFSGVSIYSTNDSAKIAFDLYSNFLYSLCTDFNQGQQLGPGGKLSAMYNAFLYRVSTSQTPYPYKGNYDLQQNDFGYTPIWQGNVISSRVRYRFLPNLWGTITTDCNMDGIAANAKDAAQYIQIGALDIKWAPKLLNNFALTIGKINLSGTYCSIFDQMPLENFLFNGLSMDYAKNKG